MSELPDISIPADLLPRDGRFGCGPSRVREDQLRAVLDVGTTVLGTSHRQAPVKNLVGRIRRGLADLFTLPHGYEVVIGNGGSTAFWDMATLGLVDRRAQALSFGEFSAKFAASLAEAPFLESPDVRRADPGDLVHPEAVADVDAYAWPQNETSTGVMAPVVRPAGADPSQLVLVDATSAAGGVMVDVSRTDAYYFAPQKAFASDGGLWLALLSPAAIERAERIAASDRWIPAFLSLTSAIENSRKDQTLNTPAVATLVMLADQIEWMLDQGGLTWADQRTRSASGLLQAWAGRRDEVTPFVTDPSARSQVVTTLDVDESIDATTITAVLRRHGVVDIEPYRKLGRNQLRIGTFPAVPEDDVRALIDCLDLVIDAIAR